MKKRLPTSLFHACAWFCGGVSLAAVFAFAFRQEKLVFAVSVEKMNVIYAGLANPLHILVSGVPEDQVRIDTKGVSLQKQGENDYNAYSTANGMAAITVSGGDLKPVTFPFRIKKIPGPDIRLGNMKSGQIGKGYFKSQQGISAPILNMDIDARCDVTGFQLTRISGKREPVTRQNVGAYYLPEVYELVVLAKPGDIYFFDNIRVKCPGDAASRHMQSMAFKIR